MANNKTNNDVWKRIYRDWLDSYNAIDVLKQQDIFKDEDEVNKYKNKLLSDIIITIESELED